VDQSVDGLFGGELDSHAQARVSVFDRSRHAIARFTLLMVLLSVSFAAFGSYFGTKFLADQAALALSSNTGPDPLGPALSIAPETTSTSAVTSSTSAASETGPAPATTLPQGSPPTTSPPALSTSSSPNQTTTTATTPLDNSPNARGQQALTAISYPWEDRLPGWSITFEQGRSGLYGLTLVDDKHIEIYVRTDQTDDLLVHIVAHELGHAVDVTLNDGPDRRRWQGARGIEDEPWWPDAAASDFRTGAGDFAESFAYWQTRTGNYRSKLGPVPDDAQLSLMAELAYG
jgi:hypothetical protein